MTLRLMMIHHHAKLVIKVLAVQRILSRQTLTEISNLGGNNPRFL